MLYSAHGLARPHVVIRQEARLSALELPRARSEADALSYSFVASFALRGAGGGVSVGVAVLFRMHVLARLAVGLAI